MTNRCLSIFNREVYIRSSVKKVSAELFYYEYNKPLGKNNLLLSLVKGIKPNS